MLELLSPSARSRREPWLARDPGPAAPGRARSGGSTSAAGTRDHQGVVAFCEPYRYADAHELAAGEHPLVVCLDQVTDPHNLGAVCRSAEGAGATGVVVTERKSARVTPAVCRASAGAVEHLPVAVVVNLSRYLDEIKGAAALGLGGGRRSRDARLGRRPGGGVALVFGAEGRGLRPGVRRACDDAFAIPLAGQVESLNVSVAAGVALFEAARQRRAR